MVVASSDKAYGTAPSCPTPRRRRCGAQHPYDVSKACADLIAQTYHDTYGLPVAVARCGNIYGGGDLNWSRIVPGTIRSLLRGERPIIRSDGTFVRDYIYVKDACIRVRVPGGGGVHGPASRRSGELRRFSAPDRPRGDRGPAAADGRTDLSPDIRNTAQAEIREQWLSFDKATQTLGWTPATRWTRGCERPSTGTAAGSETGSARERVPDLVLRDSR